jgi:hypothetical protein
MRTNTHSTGSSCQPPYPLSIVWFDAVEHRSKPASLIAVLTWGGTLKIG